MKITESRIKGYQAFLGLTWPLMVSFFIYSIDYSFNLRIFSSDTIFNFMYKLPLVGNIERYSSNSYMYIFLFTMCVLLFPLNMIYWWRVIPDVFQSRVRRAGFAQGIFMVFGCVFLSLLFISSWYIDLEALSSRRQLTFIYTFKYFILFYLFILMPVSFSAFFLSGALKFNYYKIKLLIKKY